MHQLASTHASGLRCLWVRGATLRHEHISLERTQLRMSHTPTGLREPSSRGPWSQAFHPFCPGPGVSGISLTCSIQPGSLWSPLSPQLSHRTVRPPSLQVFPFTPPRPQLFKQIHRQPPHSPGLLPCSEFCFCAPARIPWCSSLLLPRYSFTEKQSRRVHPPFFFIFTSSKLFQFFESQETIWCLMVYYLMLLPFMSFSISWGRKQDPQFPKLVLYLPLKSL